MNILSNAIDAIEESGTITIKTSIPEKFLVINIHDTGHGIPEDIRVKIFDPFFTTKPVGKGTGLGLSISLGIIEKHNGKIELKSEQGKGTEVIITLPVTQKEK
jgi:two-component system NtrC family sensor kinase